jgi:hypothetical protein
MTFSLGIFSQFAFNGADNQVNCCLGSIARARLTILHRVEFNSEWSGNDSSYESFSSNFNPVSWYHSAVTRHNPRFLSAGAAMTLWSDKSPRSASRSCALILGRIQTVHSSLPVFAVCHPRLLPRLCPYLIAAARWAECTVFPSGHLGPICTFQHSCREFKKLVCVARVRCR